MNWWLKAIIVADAPQDFTEIRSKVLHMIIDEFTKEKLLSKINAETEENLITMQIIIMCADFTATV